MIIIIIYVINQHQEYETDINLNDRRIEFVENNMTLCEENCDLIYYNYTNEKVKCSCNAKINISPNYDFKFNKNEFFRSFIDINNLANINIIKCYKVVFNINNITNNYGFYLIGSIFIFHFVTFFIYWFISYKKLKKVLLDMILILDRVKSIEVQPMIEGEKNLMKLKLKVKTKTTKKIKRKKNNEINNINMNNINIENNLGNNNRIGNLNNIIQLTKNEHDESSKSSNILKNLKFTSNNINIKYIREFIEQKDFEINSLEYEEAFKLDKRNYFKYYISLIKFNHPLMFSFCAYNDYNSRIIKIFLFFFSFSSDLTINALFFSDDTMHIIYQDRGKYDFIFQIPKIIYSALISKLIDILIKNLALSQDRIVELKREKGENKLNKKYTKILSILKVKIISFFVITFIILSFFWYYISCFCGIYTNTQIHLIKDSFISLVTSFIYPFSIYLIIALFRISALKREYPSGRYLYKLSSFLENYAA